MPSHDLGCQRTVTHSHQLQQHRLVTPAGLHQCTRFCCFEPLFGNVFRCQTSGITHVCDQTCGEKIFLDNHYDICRFSKKLFARQAEGSCRKHSMHHEQDGQAIKRRSVMHSWTSLPISMDTSSSSAYRE